MDKAKDALVQQQKVPLFHALRTFPSSSSKNIHQLIKSHRKIPKRSNSTGHMRSNEALLPPSLVNSEEDTSSDEITSVDIPQKQQHRTPETRPELFIFIIV
ncbi:hypothetical protein G6F42_028222 [Rhizopus arrhizus]|nr:hypothetical protein G6F42_028222 [Rhizopus arrhizus]